MLGAGLVELLIGAVPRRRNLPRQHPREVAALPCSSFGDRRQRREPVVGCSDSRMAAQHLDLHHQREDCRIDRDGAERAVG